MRERAESKGVEQVTTIVYDGHGRQWKVHRPEMGDNQWTTTTYNADDTVHSVADAGEVFD